MFDFADGDGCCLRSWRAPLTALSGSTTADVASQVEPRIPLCKNRRELTASDRSPSMARQPCVRSGGGARVQLVPGCHAGTGAHQSRRFLVAAVRLGLLANVGAFQEAPAGEPRSRTDDP